MPSGDLRYPLAALPVVAIDILSSFMVGIADLNLKSLY